jgi:uncharacterized repeat protein (TIGR01451 family)
MVYDSARARILASVGPSGGTLSNCVVLIDPASGALGPSFPLFDSPNKLALSDDSQFLYVGLANTGGVAWVNLSLWTNDLYFSLGVAANNFRYGAGDMKVVPGQPHAVAISIDDWQGNVALTVYDDGVARSNSVPHREFGGTYPIGFSTNNSTLYETTIFSFRTVSIDAGGATLVSEVGNLTPNYAPTFQTDHGLVFFDAGPVVDPVLETIVTNFPASGLVAPDLANGRAFFVTGAGHAAYVWQLTLHAFDSQTTRELWSVPLASGQGGVTRLVNLGTNGLAFTTDAGLLFIVQSGQLSTPRADLQATQVFTPSVIPAGANSTSAITLHNLGPAIATGILLSNSLPTGLAVTAVTASKGTILQTNPAVLVQVGSLTNGETATITLTCSATNQGLYPSRASVSSDQIAPNPGNSTALASLQVGAPLLLTINDAAVPEGNSGLSNIGFTLSLSSTSTVPVSVRYQTANGTAFAGVDYNTNAGLVTIPAGTLTGL